MAHTPQISELSAQTITEFQTRIQSYRTEIINKVSHFIAQLKAQEFLLLTKLDDIEKEMIDKFKTASTTLVEITKAREHILTILKSNTTSKLLKSNLEMYDKEIEEITKNSAMESIKIQLNWNIYNIQNICDICKSVDESISITTTEHVEPPPASMVGVGYLKPILPLFQEPEPKTQNLLKFGGLLHSLDDFLIYPEYLTDEPNDEIIDPQHIDLPLKGKWQCPNCTYYNDSVLTECEICAIPKV